MREGLTCYERCQDLNQRCVKNGSCANGHCDGTSFRQCLPQPKLDASVRRGVLQKAHAPFKRVGFHQVFLFVRQASQSIVRTPKAARLGACSLIWQAEAGLAVCGPQTDEDCANARECTQNGHCSVHLTAFTLACQSTCCSSVSVTIFSENSSVDGHPAHTLWVRWSVTGEVTKVRTEGTRLSRRTAGLCRGAWQAGVDRFMLGTQVFMSWFMRATVIVREEGYEDGCHSDFEDYDGTIELHSWSFLCLMVRRLSLNRLRWFSVCTVREFLVIGPVI